MRPRRARRAIGGTVVGKQNTYGASPCMSILPLYRIVASIRLCKHSEWRSRNCTPALFPRPIPLWALVVAQMSLPWLSLAAQSRREIVTGTISDDSGEPLMLIAGGEPPYTDPYVRWCGREVAGLTRYSLSRFVIGAPAKRLFAPECDDGIHACRA